MIPSENILHALGALGDSIQKRSPELDAIIHRSSVHNPWFTKENIHLALQNIAIHYLNKNALQNWVTNYQVPVSAPKNIGLVMAGNIPAVGFHDMISVLLSGHRVQIKLSEKDLYLIPWMIKKLTQYLPALEKRISVVTRLKGFDAVIATGSDNSARYFLQYFSNYPHVIRRNRNAVAVLDGNETPGQLKELSHDIFSFFGLGCRNVSKIYIPAGYQFDDFVAGIKQYEHLVNHNKYKNNIDYNAAIYILNKMPNISLPHLMLIEKPEIISRIGCLHYSYYDQTDQLKGHLIEHKSDIQCIVTDSIQLMNDISVVPFGNTQKPALTDYADGVDTMEFLSKL